jgi:hypothetical protein
MARFGGQRDAAARHLGISRTTLWRRLFGALDVFVVLHAVTESLAVSATGAGAAFAILIALWFVYPLYSRHHRGI